MANTQQLPDFFKHLFWSYDFTKLDPTVHAHEIITQTINYGDLDHWGWIKSFYGTGKLEQYIENTPTSEFRARAFALAQTLFNVKYVKYASRSDKIRSEAGI